MKNKGFTLAELLIVIAIIGILASMVLPRLFGPTEQSRSTEARNMMGAIRQAEEAFRNGPQGQYLQLNTDDGNGVGACREDTPSIGDNPWQRLGLGDPNANSVFFNYCVASNGTTFTITATRTNVPVGNAENGHFFTLDETGTWADDGTANAYTQRPRNPDGS